MYKAQVYYNDRITDGEGKIYGVNVKYREKLLNVG